eukprot:TRINITY_DN1999_c0_g2_i1.p1 TRINITY_DN1999_c0_g2~~TRINITY_DN1999_c0_g2_i1.p1  ORF type:complete len:298 (-),score=62.52 TRINITY_DN1999_c0_g2_i1:11-904(-)
MSDNNNNNDETPDGKFITQDNTSVVFASKVLNENDSSDCTVEIKYKANFLEVFVMLKETGVRYFGKKELGDIEFSYFKNVLISHPPKITSIEEDKLNTMIGFIKIILEKEDADEIILLKYQVLYLKKMLKEFDGNKIESIFSRLNALEKENKMLKEKLLNQDLEQPFISYGSSVNCNSNDFWVWNSTISNSNNSDSFYSLNQKQITIKQSGTYNIVVNTSCAAQQSHISSYYVAVYVNNNETFLSKPSYSNGYNISNNFSGIISCGPNTIIKLFNATGVNTSYTSPKYTNITIFKLN